MGAPLRRTESFIDFGSAASSSQSSQSSTPQLTRAATQPIIVLRTQSTTCSSSSNISRPSSPLSPTSSSFTRPLFSRAHSHHPSRTEPDLYRKALKTAMKSSPEGQKILRMGPRLAISIMSATRELEMLVAAQQRERDTSQECPDIVMADSPPLPTPVPVHHHQLQQTLTRSWVFVPNEDWEMVDCTC